MAKKERIIAYFDGSNFYHMCKINFQKTQIDLVKITKNLLKENEELLKIKYFNSPINRQEEPKKYSNQQKFFSKIQENPLVELHLGRLVKRPLNKINFACSKCGIVQVKNLECPTCGKKINISEVYKTSEKGVDVQIAIKLVLDALENNFDSALLFSGDADFSPAIKHIIEKLNKKVIFCSFNKPRTNELVNICSETRKITSQIFSASLI